MTPPSGPRGESDRGKCAYAFRIADSETDRLAKSAVSTHPRPHRKAMLPEHFVDLTKGVAKKSFYSSCDMRGQELPDDQYAFASKICPPSFVLLTAVTESSRRPTMILIRIVQLLHLVRRLIRLSLVAKGRYSIQWRLRGDVQSASISTRKPSWTTLEAGVGHGAGCDASGPVR
jgi:hypothetical protein